MSVHYQEDQRTDNDFQTLSQHLENFLLLLDIWKTIKALMLLFFKEHTLFSYFMEESV